MSEKTAEIIQKEVVAPAPLTPTPAKVETPPTVSVPADNHAEYKQTQAFIAMRKENREMKKKLAEVNANPPAPVVPVKQVEQAENVTTTPTEPVIRPAAPAPKAAEVDIETESAKAIEELATDKQVAALPGGILDIINLVDNDPRLARLHNIDPTIAFREAKNIWLAKIGINTPPPIPKATNVSGGIQDGQNDLQAIKAELDNLQPGTKRWSELAKQYKELRFKQR